MQKIEQTQLKKKRLFERVLRNPADYVARKELMETYARSDGQDDPAHPHSCPCCGHSFPAFLPGGPLLRPNACCPACESLERHRMLSLFFRKQGPPEKESVIHVAPEPPIQKLLSELYKANYWTMDLMTQADIRADITELPFGDQSIDIFIASHVLEHVTDDHKALREIRRVISPAGFGVLIVPMNLASDHTVEAPEGATPEDRLRLFGQTDHVRMYGRDFSQRLADADFLITEFSCQTLVTPEEKARHSLNDADIIYIVSREE